MGLRDELAGRSIGEFLLRERIGEGGFGAVYRCEQPLLGREAVIKVLHRRLRDNEVAAQRFLREARLASRLDHPYAAHVYAFGVEKEDGLLWIAMEMVHGTTLDRWLAERGPLPLVDLVPFFERIAEVVHTAHERGIVHRDLKPSNVMVIERAGRLLPKLLDLGIAKLLEEPSVAPARTVPRDAIATADTGVVGDATPVDGTLSVSLANVRGAPAEAQLTQGGAIGSPPYMAPEMWADGEVGPEVDIYALGVLAFEALLGRRPFVAKTLGGYVDLHTHAPIPSVGDELPRDLDRFFERALAKRPADRPHSALELAALLRVASGLGEAPQDLPKLDRGTYDAWVTDGPQPLAEAIAALDGARNLYQARDAARELLQGLLRYITVLALACHAQVREGRDHPVAGELVRALRRRELDHDEQLRLLRRLVEPFATRRDAHPLPPLVDLLRASFDNDPLAALMSIESASDGRADDLLHVKLARLVATLGRALRAAGFVLDHPLVVVRDGTPERWTGLRRRRRPGVALRDHTPLAEQPTLVDGDGRCVVLLWPLVQVLAPTPNAELEIFIFDGAGRTGARLVAAPGGFERHDASLWDWIAEHVIADAIANDTPAAAEEAPYLGLATFTAADAERFVGREHEIDTFLNRLRLDPLQVVVGASGAGKSSFVQAGVLPALDGTRIVMRPGATPLATLAGKLAAAKLPTTPAELVVALGSERLVLVVDQLEELFTMCLDDTERVAFAAALATLSGTADGPIRVVCTVRDDFLMRVEALPQLGRRLTNAIFLLGNPSHDDLVRTIVEPARRVGYELSDAQLAEDMASAVEGRPGALALLSFTASRLWELRDRRFRQLSRKAYDAMGGVGGALGRHAESLFDALGTEDQHLVRDAFRRLVTAEGTRARLAKLELEQVLAHERASAVIEKLVAARILVVLEAEGGSEIEIAHEALLSAWPRVESWIREDAESARMRDQLAAAARQWHASKRAPGLLWRGDVLHALERWRTASRGLTDLENAFADASIAEAARGRRIRRGLLVGAFAILALGLVVTLTLRQRAEDARAVADRERLRARDQLAESYEEQGRRLLLDGDANAALAYFGAASELGADSPALRFMLARALEPLASEAATLPVGARVTKIELAVDKRIVTASSDGIVRVWDHGTEFARLALAPGDVDAAWTPRGDRVIAIDTTGRVVAWNPATRESRELRAPTSSPLAFPTVRVSPDGNYVAATGAVTPETAILERATSRWTTLSPPVANVEFSAASDRVVGGRGDEGVAYVWNVDGTPVATLRGHAAGIWIARFGANDSIVASASPDGTARTFDSRTGAPLAVLRHESGVTYLAFAPAGELVATASADRTARVWNARTGVQVHGLRGHTAQVDRVRFTHDGRALVTSGHDGTVRAWDVDAGIETAAFSHPGTVFDLDVSRDDNLVASASWAGTARVFSLARSRRLATWLPRDPTSERRAVAAGGATALVGTTHEWTAIDLGTGAARTLQVETHELAACQGALSADGKIAAIGQHDGSVRIFDAQRGHAVRTIAIHRAPIACVAITSDGSRIATRSSDREVAITEVATGVTSQRKPLDAPTDRLAFSPDGRRLVAYSDSAESPRLVDASSLAVVATLGTSTVDVAAVAFSPDSRHVAVASDELAIWTVDGKQLATLPATELVFALAWSPDSVRLAAATSDGNVVVWAFGSGEHRRFQAHGTWIESIAFDRAGELLVTGAGDAAVAVWDVATARKLYSLAGSEIGHVRLDAEQRLVVASPRQLNVWRADRANLDARELREVVRCRVRKRVVDGRLVDLDDRDRAGCR